MLPEEYIGNCVAHNRPDIILVEKATWKWTIIDIAVPSDFNPVKVEQQYQHLAFEVKRIYHVEATSCDWSSRNSAKTTHHGN